MALQLQLSNPIMTNGSTLLLIRDNTGDGNLGWGSGSNPELINIDGSTLILTLDIKITKSNKEEIVVDSIDYYTYNNNTPPADLQDLVFSLSAADMEVNGTPIGNSDYKLPDGIYEIIYTLSNSLGTIDTFEGLYLIDNEIRGYIYTEISKIPDNILAKASYKRDWEYANKVLSYYAYLEGMNTNLTSTEKDRTLDQLKVLQYKFI